MSGICGIFGKGDIEEMTRVLSHRGPDDMGFYIEGPVQLGCRRLAIVDMEGGRQPMTNSSQDLWILLDGDIFNYAELRKELSLSGHSFETKTDTEVALHAWEEWGPDCLSRFNGQFALAVWDGKCLYLARDRMGEKPLYYYQRGGRLLFGSEIKSLITDISAKPRFTDEFRDFEAPLFTDTLFTNIRELMPGTYLSFDGKDLNIRDWWEVPVYDGPYRKEGDYIEELRWLLEDSVRLRLCGDVPVGVFLSGGIDSVIIASLARTDQAFTVSFPETGEPYDELSVASRVAADLDMKLHAVKPKPRDLRDFLPGMIWHLDQPVGSLSSLGVFMASQRAAEMGVKSVLVGQGADEFFGGHVRYLMMLAEDRLGREPALQHYLPLARYFWHPQMFGEPASRYYDLLNRGPGKDRKCRSRVRELFSRHHNLVDKMAYTDIHIALPTVLAMDDRATAAFGIENRNPFLDHRLVEFAFKLPPEYKVDGFKSKSILRKAMQGKAPDYVLERMDKMGLAVPVGRWFRKELKKWADVRQRRFRERYEANFLNAAWDYAGDRGEFDRKSYMRVCMELWMEIMITHEGPSWDKLPLQPHR